MLEAGLLEEVGRLRDRGVTLEHTAMQGLGYKEFFSVLEGEQDLEEGTRQTILRTRQFARRQMTWWRPDRRIEWIDRPDPDELGGIILDHWGIVPGNRGG